MYKCIVVLRFSAANSAVSPHIQVFFTFSESLSGWRQDHAFRHLCPGLRALEPKRCLGLSLTNLARPETELRVHSLNSAQLSNEKNLEES